MPKLGFATDFRGGYATDIPSENMPSNMMLKAENLVWQDGLTNRGGKSVYTTLSTSVSSVRGYFRAYQNSLWYSIAAIDTSTAVSLWKSTGTTWALYSTDGVTLQTGYNVEMDQLADGVVAVNGYDRPYILRYSTADTRFKTEYVDAYDVRTVSTADWGAGARFTTGTTQYVSYTSVAHSTASADFPLTPTTLSSDGHYIASDYPFTKVVYSSAGLLSTHAVAAYDYWTTASGWTALTSLLETAPTWTTAAGDRTVQLPYLPLWAPLDSTAYSTLLDYKYIMRVTFPTAPSTAAYCQAIALTDVHYLTRIMADERPSLVRNHANHIFLASENNVQFSPYNKLTDWDELDIEYFQDGGSEIKAMVSHLDYLLLVKPGALYGFFTNDWSNLTKRKLSVIGSQYGRSVATIGQITMFLAEDGVRFWNGTENVLVSKHIRTDIDSWTKTGANAVSYRGRYWLSFPSTSYILVADPDTFRRDDLGDGLVSWYKFTLCQADILNWHSGGGDNGYLLAVVNSTAPNITRFEDGTNYDSTGAFTKAFKTKYITGPDEGIIRRVKPEISGIGSWSFIMSADHGQSTLTTDVTVAITTTHGNRYMTTISVPYKFDGRSFAMELQTASTGEVKIYSIAYDPQSRRY